MPTQDWKLLLRVLLEDAREELAFDNQQLARVLEVHPSQIGRWESRIAAGKTLHLNQSTQDAIAQLLAPTAGAWIAGMVEQASEIRRALDEAEANLELRSRLVDWLRSHMSHETGAADFVFHSDGVRFEVEVKASRSREPVKGSAASRVAGEAEESRDDARRRRRTQGSGNQGNGDESERAG